MTRVRFTETISTAGECYRRGKEYDVEDARPYVANGVAVPVKPDKAEKKKPDAPPPADAGM